MPCREVRQYAFELLRRRGRDGATHSVDHIECLVHRGARRGLAGRLPRAMAYADRGEPRGQAAGVPLVHRTRTTEKEPLHQIDTKIQERFGLVLRLYALGEGHGPEMAGHAEQGTEDLLLLEVGVDPAHEVPIDLDDVRLEPGNAIQVRMTRAHVVEGNDVPRLAVGGDPTFQLQLVGYG